MATSTKFQGFQNIIGNTTNPMAITVAGQRRMDFGNASLSTQGSQSAALLFGLGTSSGKATTSSANKKFISFYLDSSATSGEVSGLYLRTYASGAGGSLIAARIFGTVSDVAAVDARGAHISLSFGTSGTVTSSGQALTTTLHIPNTTPLTGSLSCITAEITSDGSTSDPAGATSLAFFRCEINGDTTGDDDVIDDAVLFDLSGIGDANAAHIWVDTTSNAADQFIKVRTPAGIAYLVLTESLTFS